MLAPCCTKLKDKSKYMSLPVGAQVAFTVKDVKKRTDKPKYNYIKADGTDLGFHHEFISECGCILTVGILSLMYALRGIRVDKGMRVSISRNGHDVYEAKVVN